MKLLFSFLLLTICFNFGFAQNNSKLKLTEAQKLEAKREKFDSNRNPHLDLQVAIAKAQKENKRIVLDIGGEWCSWCRKMDFYLMQNKGLAKLRDKNFVWIKVNFSEENENQEFLSKYPEIPGYPHLFVLEKDGSFLYSKSTSELEKGKSYNLQKFTDFLNEWSFIKNSKK